ncbi:MAG: 30S ribosomal protein S2, partial [Candidatus Marinimicrobia bacterium]|nr:30S ribosomal protein S2 [Candidatus Neomarinimicrobiota bacterium]
ANRLEIPVVAIVDSNTDPRPIDYPIPANDDSIRAIQLIISSLSDGIIAVKNGVKENEENVMELDSSSLDEKTDNAEVSENIVIKEDITSEKKINVEKVDEDNEEEYVEAIKDDEADSNEESKEQDSKVSEDKDSANTEEE